MKHVCNMWTFSYILSEENCSFSILEYKQKIWWFAQGRHQVSAHKSWISPLKSQYICLFNVEQPVSGLLLPPLLQCRDLKQRQMPPKRQVTVIQKALPSRWKSRWGHWKRQWSKPWKKRPRKHESQRRIRRAKDPIRKRAIVDPAINDPEQFLLREHAPCHLRGPDHHQGSVGLKHFEITVVSSI